MKDHLIPQVRPKFDFTGDKEHDESVFTAFQKYIDDEDVRFELAMKRMKWCFWFKGFLYPFGGGEGFCIRRKWCPHEQWDENLFERKREREEKRNH